MQQHICESMASSATNMALAMEREQIRYSSLVLVAGTVLADPEPMLARLVRGCIALAFTACVPDDLSSHRLADTPSS